MPEPFTQEELNLLAAAPAALQGGVELLEWWRRTDAEDSYEYRYPESFVFNRPEDRSFGFFDTVELSTGPQRVNGNVQDMFYDEPKSPGAREGGAAAWVNQQMQEFVLHYFMRISDFRPPQAFPEAHQPTPPGLGFLSICPGGDPQVVGFGFSQIYYKRINGEIGRFSPARRDAIIDVRQLGTEYEWVILKNPIFNFKFEFKPFGNHAPHLAVPLTVSNYLIMSPAFVIDEKPKEKGIIGRYGLGYAFIRDPVPSPLGYGPGELEPAFELLQWDVHESGEITSRAVFVANEPEKMLNLSIDPLAWTFQIPYAFSGPQLQEALRPMRLFFNSLPWSQLRFDPVFPSIRLLNLLTLGQAEQRLCISVDQLRKSFLFLHFQQHYDTLLGSLQTWRQIPDWLDRKALPAFVVDGRSS